MNSNPGTSSPGSPSLHWKAWLERVVHQLNQLPPDMRPEMLRESAPVSLEQLMVLLDRAARFEHLVNYSYAVQKNLDALPTEDRNVERLWDALGNFLKAFSSTLQGVDGQERVPAPAFISVAMGEIANLQRGIPSRRFRSDGNTLGDNPHEVQTLTFKAFAATFLQLLMDREKRKRKQDGPKRNREELAELVAEAVNDGGLMVGHKGDVSRGQYERKDDKGVSAWTIIDWRRAAQHGKAPFSESYRKNLAAYRERCKPENIEAELADLTRQIRATRFLPRGA